MSASASANADLLMRAAVLHGPGQLQVRDVERPVPGPGEALVQVMVSGICGSDLPRVLGTGARRYPIILGHEFSGVIAEVGEGTGIALGSRVAGVPLLPCDECRDCASGHYSQCRNYSFLGSRVNGSWAEYVVVPERNLLRLADSMSFESGAMIEPSSVALHAFRLARYDGGGHVAVIGAGNIGVFATQWARLLGADQVTVFDIDEARLATATALGADLVQRTDLEQDDWREQTGSRGFDLVIESSGVSPALTTALQLVASKGTIVSVGTPTRPVSFDPHVFELLHRKEATVIGSWMSYSSPFPGEEWTSSVRAFESGRLTCDSLVAARFPLEDANGAFDLYRSGEAVRGKVLLYNNEYFRSTGADGR
ncbi:galactitol-1-phosphate 5-dehydrogenase [Microbacterium sp. dk485]|uniref:galactitol-1-phosphate 5-dehydrogenase n=1 Tax=Microbacterium sp. dk485 TaxID=2560021 RepID=UPI001ADD8EB2|nr:galactitol-1-phosphate 5-dehydrogenase [Microbacterium sp. dk485]